MEVNLEEVFDSDISSHSVRVALLKVEPDISSQEICLVCIATCNIQICWDSMLFKIHDFQKFE